MTKKIDPRIWWLIIVLLPLVSVGACILSESFQGEGYMEAWHDSDKVTDRTTAQGRYDYGAEIYPSGLSSGLNISNGSASYSFQSGDYSIRLKKFSGEIVAEADSNGTIIDLSGSGKMSAISYPTRPYASSVRPFPIGGLKGEGKLFLHAATEFENIPIEVWNGTEWANTPVNQTPVIDINQTTNETETIDSINDTTWIDGDDWDDTTVIFI
ncbi:MAG: hypothetical protein PHD55_06295 [Methanoregula sp.]|nr:hypothetical protein [Methanoregula sp.]